MPFADRQDAGRQLAERLLEMGEKDPIILALPRGGIPVGFEIASALKAPLDVVLVHKIGAPFQREFAIGAVADGLDPELFTNTKLVKDLHILPAYLTEARSSALREIERRRALYVGDHSVVEIKGRTVIVVDDGIATGATMLAALRGTRRREAARIVLAVPVAAQDALLRLESEVEKVVCLRAPEHFQAVGEFYQNFTQLRDAEVIALLDRARRFAASPAAGEDHA